MKTTAYDVAARSGEQSEYSFSMDHAKVVAALREVIAEIESGKLIVQKASFETTASCDDYAMTHVHLEFHEKQ